MSRGSGAVGRIAPGAPVVRNTAASIAAAVTRGVSTLKWTQHEQQGAGASSAHASAQPASSTPSESDAAVPQPKVGSSA